MNTYLPGWAERKAVGTELCIGRQLATRDGRRLGNAVITGFESKTYGNDPTTYVVYHVRTDAGNVGEMTEAEVNECFYLGDYIMKSVAPAIPRDDVRALMYHAWRAGHDYPNSGLPYFASRNAAESKVVELLSVYEEFH